MQFNYYKFTHVSKNLLFPSLGWIQYIPPRRWNIFIDHMVLSSTKRRSEKKIKIRCSHSPVTYFQAVSPQRLIRKDWFQYRVRSCEMYIGLNDFGRVFSPNSSVLPHQYYPTSVSTLLLLSCTTNARNHSEWWRSLYKSLTLSPCRWKGHRERRLLCAPLFHTTGHTVCANQLPGENKPDIQLREYQSSDISTSHLISFHTHTIISFGSDLLLYFHLFICLPINAFK
jgi:hypothetical protein